MATSFNLEAMPLVLCGPMVRKVQYNNVSVWLAFKEEVSSVTLQIFEAATRKPVLSGTDEQPLKLGKNLCVSLVTAVSNQPVLRAGVIYGYDISFKLRQKDKTGNDTKKLTDAGVLFGGIKSIAYDPYTFPTFCLPADNVNDLKITHGSCRKPHGGKTDALRALDTMIEINCQDPSERPQLLCLTGDQIYADDVSDVILYRIQQAIPVLLGWKEKLPKDYLPEELSPGNRTAVIAATGNKLPSLARDRFSPFAKTAPVKPDDLTTTDSRSHLVYLGEFILMYLFNYSECFYYPDWPAYDEIYKLGYEHTKLSAESFSQEMEGLNEFVRALPFVRKAMANISCLMIFDDHDVTDDFFITKEWCAAALSPGSTSRRYVLNGMIAYAVCQDWGNNFEKYKSGNGKAILDSLQLRIAGHPYMVMRPAKDNYLKCIDRYPNPYAKKLETIILPALAPDTASVNKSTFLRNNFRWDYRVNYRSFDLFVLNTRSERQFYDKEKPLGNLVRSIYTNGNLNGNKLAVIVSAAPVFGNISMEKNQEEARSGGFTLAGVIGGRYAGKMGMYSADQEAWLFSNIGFTRLLSFISVFKKVLILSGDVHYAFTSYIRLWKKYGSAYKLTEVVQSVSSSLKNSTGQTHYPAIDKYGLAPKAGTPYKMVKIVSYADPKRMNKPDNNPRFRDIASLVRGYQSAFPHLSMDPNIQFTMQYLKSPGFDITGILPKLMSTKQAKVFRDRLNDNFVHNTVIGKDSISLISFKQGSLTNSIWFAGGTMNAPDPKEANRLLFPFAKHTVSFNAGFKPEELPATEFLARVKRNVTVTTK